MILESAFHVNEEGVSELTKYLSLVEHGLDVVLLDDSK